MRHLDRMAVSVPSCLPRLRSNARRSNSWDWKDATGQDRGDIICALTTMQNGRCAYCEAILSDAKHIEHFRPRNAGHGHQGFPQEMFDWDNLFLSCMAPEHCGQFKDSGKPGSYSPNDLIDPCIDYPERMLCFKSSGEVCAASGLSAGDLKKATTTIKILGLDCVALRQSRRSIIKKWMEAVVSLKGLSSKELEDVLAGESFPTAIKQNLPP